MNMFKKIVFGLAILAMLAVVSPLRAAEEHAGAKGAAAAPEAAPAEHGREHGVIEFDAATAVWVVIIFVVLLAILYPTAWKSVLDGLKKREERIRKDIADAEAARAKAEATLKQYQNQLAEAESKVREMIAGAVSEGEKIAADIRAKAQHEGEETRQRALREIESAKQQALSEIYERAADISTSIAAKILRRSINPDDQRDLVQQGLAELETASK
jgi:F-type H+-transporting ATPase subunit b